MKNLKLLQYHFLFLILIYEVVNWTILHLKCYSGSLYIDIVLKQTEFITLLPVQETLGTRSCRAHTMHLI